MANDNNFLNPRRPFFNLPFSTYHNYYRPHLRKNSNCLQGETNLKFSFSLTRKKERRERENEKEKIRESSKRRKKEEKSV